jgi:UTP--glucose-1-phosphate uridylyltransferase
MRIKTVIIPAAGRGMRLLPATRVTAKELLPVFDRVAIDFAIDEAVGIGAERIIVVISKAKTAIRTYLRQATGPAEPRHNLVGDGRWSAKPEIVYVFQDKPKGLGHAILCCKDKALTGAFAVLLPDDIIMGQNCLAEMAASYRGGHMVAAMQVEAAAASQYGIFQLGGLPKGRTIPVSGMVEKPAPGTAPSSFAAVGRYLLDPMICDVLAHTPYGAGGELQLTDAISIAALATPLVAFRFSGTRHDCGNHEGLLAAAIARQTTVRADAAAGSTPLALPVEAPKSERDRTEGRQASDWIGATAAVAASRH